MPGASVDNNVRHLVLVLGMHRSGTSVLTRALPVFGVDIGSGHLGRKDNPRGFFEAPPFVHLNERLFVSLGMRWNGLEEQDYHAFIASGEKTVLTRDALAFLRSFCHEGFVGLKDPRLCRLLPFWRPIMESEGLRISCLLALRSPETVAASLENRDGMDFSSACDLWTLYVLESILFSVGLPRLLLSYDRLLEAPKGELTRIASFLHLPLLSAEEITFRKTFLEKGLRHHTGSSVEAVKNGPAYERAITLYKTLLPLTRAADDAFLRSPRLVRWLRELRLAVRGRTGIS